MYKIYIYFYVNIVSRQDVFFLSEEGGENSFRFLKYI